MTGRTHDLAALTALNLIVATQPIGVVALSTAVVSIGACMIGGLTPDIDQPASSIWHKVPAGSIIGRIIHPFLGGHRSFSHSILGFIVISLLVKVLLDLISQTLIVDMYTVWIAFLIGFLSHLLMDTLNQEGVPWFFPISFRIGFPPLKILRIRTGGLIEKLVVFPGLLLLNAYFIYTYYPVYLRLLRQII